VNFANNEELNYMFKEGSEPEESKQGIRDDISSSDDDEEANFREQLDY
jgi:hypothetical protein